MKKINPLYFRFNRGWLLRDFLKKGTLFGIVFGIAMLPAVFGGFDIFNTFPFKIIFYIGTSGGEPDIRFLTIPIVMPDYIIWFLFVIIMYFSYYALLGAFAGFISNAMLCICKKVKIKIDEEDIDSIDYLDFSKKMTRDKIRMFLDFGVILTIIAVAVPSYFLWDIEIEFGNVSDLMWKLTH
ncbi:MAG: hypothetical protein J6Q00_04270 [Verrucomicrobia bacterium]|nr:hypothetical protein [Verrucomicrobiota bacterium]